MESPQHGWKFYLTARDAWKAMYRDCAKAKSSIELEQYIFGDDALGRRFMQLFIRKARQGVKVFIVFDKFGSLEFFKSPLLKQLRNSGGHFRFYNAITRWNILTPWRWFPRTHVKTLLIDSSIAYVGSACMAGYMARWRDTQMRLIGPAVAYIRQAFDNLERRLLHRKPSVTEAPPRHHLFRYVINQPRLARHRIYRELAESIAQAGSYIYITASYFIPHRAFFQLLKEARRRGVEIILLLPEHSDIRLADWVHLSYAPRLFEAGVRVYLYQDETLHCKTAVIDDKWATLGSANFDVISFFHNREANMIITDPGAVAELKQQFLHDLGRSRELTRKEWLKLPRWKKAVGYAARKLKVFF